MSNPFQPGPQLPPPPPRSFSTPLPFSVAPEAAPGYGPGPPVSSRRNGKAVAALVLGLCSVLLFATFVVPLLALIFGLIAAGEVRRSGQTQTGAGMARAGWILGALGLAGFVAIVFVAIRDRSDDLDEARDIFDIGTCVNLPDPDVLTDEVDLEPVDCDTPHDGELFHSGRLNEDRDRRYPGTDRAFDEAGENCTDDPFASYIGLSYNESQYNVYVVIPSELGWKADGGRYSCYAFDPSGDTIVGSIEGAGR